MKKIEHVLLVDDDELTNFLHRRLLDRMGISRRTTVYRSGADALGSIADDWPGLILLALHLPGMDGFAFMEEYSRRMPGMAPVVYLVSASAGPADLDRLPGHGISGLLQKPLTREALQEVIDRHF